MLLQQLELFPAYVCFPSPRMETPPASARLPKTHQVETEFTWVPVEFLLSIPSVDFFDDGMRSERNRQIKRNDYGYEDLKDDIAENGFINPVFLYCPEGDRANCVDGDYALGNGHHRVVAAYDLGFTHVPVTIDYVNQWDSDGCSTR